MPNEQNLRVVREGRGQWAVGDFSDARGPYRLVQLFHSEKQARSHLAALNASDALRGALEQIVDEKCDYMRINNLGDPETQHTVKAARAALAQVSA